MKTKIVKNYRKFYENKTGVKTEKGFDIHHLDFNKSNNNINNLVRIPSKLHKGYHRTIELYKDAKDLATINELQPNINDLNNQEYFYNKEFIQLFLKIQKYKIEIKEYIFKRECELKMNQ